jgi:hypothetical protein
LKEVPFIFLNWIYELNSLANVKIDGIAERVDFKRVVLILHVMTMKYLGVKSNIHLVLERNWWITLFQINGFIVKIVRQFEIFGLGIFINLPHLNKKVSLQAY